MRIIESLNQIKPTWLERVSHRLARGEGVRQSFVEQLNLLFDLMQQAIITGDPAWINPVLDAWAEARTQSELEQQEASLGPMLNQILISTFHVAQERLDSASALELLGAVTPLYTHAFMYTAEREARLHIQHISAELEQAKYTLEKIDKSKSDFIAVAAHELKTPLTLIEGYAAMLRDHYPQDDQESNSILLLKGIDNGTRRLREIIDDMIDVSLLDNDMLQLNFQPIWIYQLLNIAKRELGATILERRQQFEVSHFEGIDRMTYGDAERLYQALRNLLTNAIKYTPDGGTITVAGRELPGFIEVTIQDTGIGIDEADHERIFEKFGRLGNIQLHSSGKTKFKGGGPGLGLSITRGIIEAHGGSIWVESEGYDEELCPGATFHVLIPIRKDPPDQNLAQIYKPLSELQPGMARITTVGDNTPAGQGTTGTTV